MTMKVYWFLFFCKNGMYLDIHDIRYFNNKLGKKANLFPFAVSTTHISPKDEGDLLQPCYHYYPNWVYVVTVLDWQGVIPQQLINAKCVRLIYRQILTTLLIDFGYLCISVGGPIQLRVPSFPDCLWWRHKLQLCDGKVDIRKQK